MSNVIRLPFSSRDGEGPTASATKPTSPLHLLKEAPPHTHAVQFYEGVDSLFQTVGDFLEAGIVTGDRIVVIATSAHREGFLARFDQNALAEVIGSGQLTVLDAHETLQMFMVGEMPDPDLFRATLDSLVTKMRLNAPTARIRAYGEMVDVLWRTGNTKAAIRLEELWEVSVKEHSLSLLCAYLMGNFYREADATQFMEVCRNHSHVFPTERFSISEMDNPHARLREISLLQQRARALETEIDHRKQLEVALREALQDRAKMEAELRESVKREHEARLQAEKSDAFKEEFLGILGHDLRNPLNTILTTARLMTMRGELLPGDSRKRLDRVVVSGVRMQRMIEQILDVTRDRLTAGIPVACGAPKDVIPLVKKIADEVRLAHPARKIEVLTPTGGTPCIASVDDDRLEQVLSNLLGNAIAHGDPNRAIDVTVECATNAVNISVHNFGTPIDPSFIPHLFDPFRRAGSRKSVGRSEGLGLGLYISERIISGHGGTITVTSSAEDGTTFHASLPAVAVHERSNLPG